MHEPVTLTTSRLQLRPFVPADVDAVHAACQDPDIQRWIGAIPSPYAREDAAHFVQQVAPAGWASGSHLTFAVTDASSGELLGNVGLHVPGLHSPGVAEIGFWCAAPARGRGVITEAAAAVAAWGFGRDVARLEWYAEVGNTASRRVAEKLGFSYEGCLRARLLNRGRRVDAWVGSLLPGELIPPTPPTG
jgi:RimJ/RimL family protein N-acetyltransferase